MLGARPALTDKEKAKRRRVARKGGLARKKNLGGETGIILPRELNKSPIELYRSKKTW